MFEEAGYAVYIVVKSCRVAEVDERGVCGSLERVGIERICEKRTVVEESLDLLDVAGCSTESVDALDVQTEEVNGLHALIDNHRNGGLISCVQVIKESMAHWCSEWRRKSHEGPLNWLGTVQSCTVEEDQ